MDINLLFDDINLNDEVTERELEIFKHGKKDDRDELLKSGVIEVEKKDDAEISKESDELIEEFKELEAEIETEDRKKERQEFIKNAIISVNQTYNGKNGLAVLIYKVLGAMIAISIAGIFATSAYIVVKTANAKFINLDNTHNTGIFVSGDNMVDSTGELSIHKISIGKNNTFFYLENLDLYSDYTITLVGDDGEYYAVNEHYMSLLGERGKNILVFDAFSSNTKEFNIIIKDLYSSQVYLDLYCVLNNEYVYALPERFIRKQGNESIVQLEYADFADELTVIGYIFKAFGDEQVNFDIGKNFTDNKVYLKNGNTYIPPKSDYTYTYNYNNSLYMENAFANIEDVQENLKLSVENVIKTVDIKQTLNGQDLLINKNKIIEIPSYQVIFEGFQRYKNTATLVYHVKDNNDYTSGDFEKKVSDAYPDRSKGNITAKLEFKKNGQIIELEPTYNNYGEIGGDIVFVDDRLENTQYSDLNIYIDNIAIDEPIYVFSFDKEENNNIEIEEALINIKKAFDARSEYASGINLLSQVPFMDESILYDEKMLEVYSVIDDASDVFIDSNIISFGQGNEKNSRLLFCLVNERGQYIKDRATHYIYRKHEVIFDLDENIVISDKIIEE